MADDDVEQPGRQFGRELTWSFDEMHSGPHVVRLHGQGGLEAGEQVSGDVQAGDVVPGTGEKQSLRALSTSHIKHSGPAHSTSVENLGQLGGKDVLTDHVTQPAQNADPLINSLDEGGVGIGWLCHRYHPADAVPVDRHRRTGFSPTRNHADRADSERLTAR